VRRCPVTTGVVGTVTRYDGPSAGECDQQPATGLDTGAKRGEARVEAFYTAVERLVIPRLAKLGFDGQRTWERRWSYLTGGGTKRKFKDSTPR